jgi:hypothetical protein
MPARPASADEIVASVSGDGAYDTKGCHEVITKRGAQAIIPTRKNAKRWKHQRLGATVCNAILAATRRLGKKIWKKWSVITGQPCRDQDAMLQAAW